MKSQRPALLALIALLLAAVFPAESRAARGNPRDYGQHPWCGTQGNIELEGLAKHRMFQRRNLRLAKQRALASKRGLEFPERNGLDIERATKNVAVIEDDGSLISSSNVFDLDGSAISIKRKGSRVKVSGSGAGINTDVGDRILIGDDASVEIDLAFKFRFFGTKYSSVFLNSDGNLTFEESDFASSERSVSRAVNGPPRIAPFFADLDPSVVGGSEGIFVKNGDKSLRVTWQGVPEFGTFNDNTFQVTLFKNGRIVFAFGDLDAAEGVVGVAPGGAAPFEFVDYTDDGKIGPTELGVLERFTIFPEIDDLGVAKAFLTKFRDIYDHVIVWLDFPLSLNGAFAFELTIKNQIRGIGVPIFDVSRLAGSDGTLESFVQMGFLGQYPPDPDVEFLGTNSSMEILGQETGHRWGAFVRFRDGNGSNSNGLLGRDQAHWSFFADTDASVLEGNDIQDNGDGTFRTVESTERFSPLDQYLMGVRGADDVPDFFYVAGALAGNNLPESAPAEGVTITGSRVDVTIDQVIAAEGVRNPSAEDAKNKFKMAFLLLGRNGEPPSQASIDKVNAFAKRWKGFFKAATDGRATVSTKLKLKK